MQAVILAGGLGTRLSEETHLRPKPMIEIGGMPILWHIMKMYSCHGINDFIVCCGYKGYMIKEYFSNYFLHMSDVTFDMSDQRVTIHDQRAEPWRVTVVDTGEATQTGGRIKRVRNYLSDDSFCLTYGDAVADIDIAAVLEHHRAHDRQVTISAVRPPGRYGALDIAADSTVTRFEEKPRGDGNFINGGFFVVNRTAVDAIDGDATSWESDVLEKLCGQGEVSAYEHDGFWRPMDTLRDKRQLEDLWATGAAPWKTWD